MSWNTGTGMQGMRQPVTIPYHCTHYKPRSLTQLRTNATNFCTVAELLIGPKPVRFHLHTSLLTSQSPYFRAALTSSFLESTSQSISLPDVDVDTFGLLVGWLYSGTISPVPFKDGKPAYYALLHLWVLADRLCFEGLRNCVLDAISECADRTNSVPTPSDTRILYDAVPDGSGGEKLRGLVLDLFAFKKTDRLLEEHQGRWHAAFLRDLVVRLKRPCEQALLRHRLRMWIPERWRETRACEACHVVLPPRYGAVVCDECCLAWCLRCVREGVGMAGWEDGRGRAGGDVLGKSGKWETCKPWRGSRCRVYHEHEETERCADVFLGR